ncbi:MAG: manganese-dependent inorganic pyrophosphatase [Defluviitaleaceae bacterium]|nr:manganese-dependent inorganic pyrophosphatase [Defluviitaleaceae bacterium]
MMKIFGHQNPDTDTITSAIVMADLQNALGNPSTAYRLGELNKETAFALDYFKVDTPELLTTVDDQDTVILVDHNEFAQSVAGIEKATPYMVVDHHRVAGFSSSEPLFFRIEPVGCTATILYRMYLENNIEIKPEIAGLMASAIVSDSLLFKSPTCTAFDREVCLKLAQIANIEIETYGLDLLKAGTDLSDLSVDQMLTIDAKVFTMNGISARIAQINTVDIEGVMTRQPDIETEMNNAIAAESLDLFMFVITDIMNSNSQAIVLGDRIDLVEKAFDTTLEQHAAYLPGVVSRKKQIVPPLEKASVS